MVQSKSSELNPTVNSINELIEFANMKHKLGFILTIIVKLF